MYLANGSNPYPFFAVSSDKTNNKHSYIRVVTLPRNCIDDYRTPRLEPDKNMKKIDDDSEHPPSEVIIEEEVISGEGEDRSGVAIEEEVASSDENDKNETVDKKNTYKIVYFVLILDYDLTLVDSNSRPFPSVFKFLFDIDNLQKQNTIFKPLKVIWSLGSDDYVKSSLKKHFKSCKFDFVKTNDSEMKTERKRIGSLRKDLKKYNKHDYLSCPVVIIDDQEKNLNKKDYNVTINVKNYYKYNEKNEVVDVKYNVLLKDLKNKLLLIKKTKE